MTQDSGWNSSWIAYHWTGPSFEVWIAGLLHGKLGSVRMDLELCGFRNLDLDDSLDCNRSMASIRKTAEPWTTACEGRSMINHAPAWRIVLGSHVMYRVAADKCLRSSLNTEVRRAAILERTIRHLFLQWGYILFLRARIQTIL